MLRSYRTKRHRLPEVQSLPLRSSSLWLYAEQILQPLLYNPACSTVAQANPQASLSVRPGALYTTAVNVNYPKGGEITQ